MRRSLAISALVMAAMLTALPAHAERLIVSVSNHRVTVTPNYSGEELVLFGSVEKDANTPPNRNYDLVVTVSGPRADMVTRRKERRFGIWINTDSRQFLQVPAYLAIFSDRPIEAIASPEVAVPRMTLLVPICSLPSLVFEGFAGSLTPTLPWMVEHAAPGGRLLGSGHLSDWPIKMPNFANSV